MYELKVSATQDRYYIARVTNPINAYKTVYK